jgi:hypothetical protein
MIVMVVGILVTLAFLLADQLGLGANPEAFGMRQSLGTLVGVILVIIGFILRRRSQAGPPAA